MRNYYALLLLISSLIGVCSRHQAVAQAFGDISTIGGTPSSGQSISAGTNLATGTLAPVLPLLSLPGTAGSIDINLQYTAGAGVKVNDLASEVGLGWNLTGTGLITREVKGLPDDGVKGWFINHVNWYNFSQPTASSMRWDLPKESSGDLVNYFNTYEDNYGNPYPYSLGEQQRKIFLTWLYPASRLASFGQYGSKDNPYYQYDSGPNSYANNWEARFSGKWTTDNEPDVYTISLPVGRIQFVFDAAGKPVALSAQNIKIDALNLGDKRFKEGGLLHEFRITTNDGVQYLFGSPNGDDSYKETMALSTKTLEEYRIPSKTDYKCIYKWLLKEIVYPNKEAVSYRYKINAQYNYTINTNVQQDYVYTLNEFGSLFSQNYPYQPDPKTWSSTSPTAPTGSSRYWRRFYTSRTTVESVDYKQIASISNRQAKIEFIYSPVDRQDVGGTTKPMSGIKLTDKAGNLIKELSFVQHYADHGSLVANAQPYDRYHLLLDKVINKEAGCANIAQYDLAYNTQSFCRNSAMKDYWGYLNSLTYPSNGVLVAPISRPTPFAFPFYLTGRSCVPNAELSQALILKNITYESGSKQSFDYELHDGFFLEFNQSLTRELINGVIGGLRVKSISQYDGINHANDIIENYEYKKSNGTNQSSGCIGDLGQYAKLQVIYGAAPYNNLGKFRNDDEIRGLIPICIDAPDYRTNPGSYFYSLRTDASMYQYAADYIDYSCVTVNRGNKGKTRYEFTNWNDNDHKDYVNLTTTQYANNLNICPGDPLNPGTRGYRQPLPFSLELNGLPLANTGGVSADFPQRSSRAAERGLVTKVQQLTANGEPVEETLYNYDFTHSSTPLRTVTGVYIKSDMEILGFSQFPRYFQLYFYNHDVKWTPLVETTNIIYDQQNAGNVAKRLINTTLIEYNNFYPSKITKFSGLSPRSSATAAYVTESRRPLDFTTLTATDRTSTPALLRDANMTATVVEQISYQLLPGGNTRVHSGATLTEYQDLNGLILPAKSYTTKAKLTSFQPSVTRQINGALYYLSKDDGYLETGKVTGYTAEGLPVNTESRSGTPQATIWGYGHTMPIATIQNGRATTGATGSLATAGHTSFEEDGGDGDNWALPAQFSSEAKTGVRSARFIKSQNMYGIDKSLLIPPGEDRQSKFVFSCWAKIPVGVQTATNFHLVAVSSGNGYDQGQGLIIQPGQDWKYCELLIDLADPKWNQDVAANQNLPLKLYMYMPWGDELLLDEMQVHRADAMMQTTTYQPLVGRTSTTNSKGITTYFTYDNNLRPRLILNHNRDIVQRTQQHSRNEATKPSAAFTLPTLSPVNCPITLAADYGSCASGATFSWNFGDGRPVSNSALVQHVTYSQPGTYQVTLTVTSQDLGTATSTKTINIQEPFYTEINIQGYTFVDLCETPDPEPVVLTAQVADNCRDITYRWQFRLANQSFWTDAGETSNVYTRRVLRGTYYVRCIVGQVGGGDNSSYPNLQETEIIGYASGSCPY